MGKALETGKVRAIGLSNFDPARIEDLILATGITSAALQLQANVLCQQLEMEDYLVPHDIKMTAWGPLAEGSPDLFGSPVLAEIAKARGKSVAQVALAARLRRDPEVRSPRPDAAEPRCL